MKNRIIALLSFFLRDPIRGVGTFIHACLPVLNYLFLVRIVCIALLFMALLPLLSWLGPLRSLTVGAFDVVLYEEETETIQSWLTIGRSFLATMLFLTSSGGLITIAEMYANEPGKRYLKQQPAAIKAMTWWNLLGITVVWINVIWMFEASDRNWEVALGSILAFIFTTLLAGAAWARIPFFQPALHWLGKHFPALPGWLKKRGILGWESKAGEQFLHNTIGRVFNLLSNTGSNMTGILSVDSTDETPDLETGQLRTLVYFFILFIIYGCFMVAPDFFSTKLPPVAAIHFLVVFWAFLISFLTFVFDRYRVPFTLILLAYFGFCTLWHSSDHYYAVKPLEGTPSTAPIKSAASGKRELGAPAQLIGKAGKEHKPVIIISMAGGGIQAAAWPIAALEEIERQTKGFRDSVVMISGVSGGSIGAMYYAGSYPNAGQTGTSEPAKHAKEAAMSSSLAPITFASMADDLPKALLPILSTIPWGRNVLRDRGLALEQSFASTASTCKLQALEGATLESWTKDALARQRPALVLNGTVVETGERISYSTAPVAKPKPGAVEFTQRYHADLNITTAARMTATFPFISPAARPLACKDSITVGKDLPIGDSTPGPSLWNVFPKGGSLLHVVDGGYFEVSAVVGAIDWLNDACEQLAEIDKFNGPDNKPASASYAMPDKILFLQLSGFPEPDSSDPKAVDAGKTTKGAVFDAIAPIQTAIGIRNSVQASFSSDIVSLTKKRWGSKPELIHARLRPILKPEEWDFEYSNQTKFLPQDPPLSWHLQKCEKDGIKAQVDQSAKPNCLTPSAAKCLENANEGNVLTIQETVRVIGEVFKELRSN